MKKKLVFVLLLSLSLSFMFPAIAEASFPNGATSYTVKPGDSLWKIAKEVFGNGAMYKTIHNMNAELIKDPSHIFPGQQLRMSSDVNTHDITIVDATYKANKNLNIGDSYHILNGNFTIDADPSVAYIDDNGNIVAVSPGQIKIDIENGMSQYLYVWAERSRLIFVKNPNNPQLINEAGFSVKSAISSDTSVATVSVKAGYAFIQPLKSGLVTVTITDTKDIQTDCYFTVIDCY